VLSPAALATVAGQTLVELGGRAVERVAAQVRGRGRP